MFSFPSVKFKTFSYFYFELVLFQGKDEILENLESVFLIQNITRKHIMLMGRILILKKAVLFFLLPNNI